MSKKAGVVEQPDIVDEEGEESDDYDDIEEEEEEEVADEEEEHDEHDEEGLTQQGSSLTALLLGGGANGEGVDEDDEDDEEEDDEDEYTPIDIKGPATEAIESAPPPAIGMKRTREEDEPSGREELTGDYGEFEENSENVKKKARAAAEEEA